MTEAQEQQKQIQLIWIQPKEVKDTALTKDVRILGRADLHTNFQPALTNLTLFLPLVLFS